MKDSRLSDKVRTCRNVFYIEIYCKFAPVGRSDWKAITRCIDTQRSLIIEDLSSEYMIWTWELSQKKKKKTTELVNGTLNLYSSFTCHFLHRTFSLSLRILLRSSVFTQYSWYYISFSFSWKFGVFSIVLLTKLAI